MRAVTRAGVCVAAAGVLTAVFAVSAISGKPKSGSFYSQCSFSPKQHKLTVRVLDEEGEIRRRGGRIGVADPSVGLYRCTGGKPTIRNTDRIKLQIRAEGMTTGRLSLAGGALAPGRTPETEGPEIEIKLQIADRFASPEIVGTAGDDHFRGGSLGAVQGLNLNVAAEPTFPDVDVRLVDAAKVSSSYDMGTGNDVLDLGGGPEFLGPLTSSFALVTLGPGGDRFVGGSEPDLVLASAGLDQFATGAGDDGVNSQDGIPEIVDCGPGHDRVQPDQSDTLASCEELSVVGIFD